MSVQAPRVCKSNHNTKPPRKPAVKTSIVTSPKAAYPVPSTAAVYANAMPAIERVHVLKLDP